MELSPEMIKALSFVKRGKSRQKIIKSLTRHPKMPRDIAQETGIRQSNVSTTLTKLSEQGLVCCVNPEVKRGRVYRLTEKGEEIVAEM